MKIPLNLPAGIVADATSHDANGRWADGSNVRWSAGRPEVVGGWEGAISERLSGVCRNILPWTDKASRLNIALGTHLRLQLFQGGGLYDITPEKNAPPTILAEHPLTVVNGSGTVSVSHPGHGLATGDLIALSGVEPVGRIKPEGVYGVTVTSADAYTITGASAAALSRVLGANPLAVTNGSALVTVTDVDHRLAAGATVTISGAGAVGGITPNGAFPIEVVSPNVYRFTFTSNANASAVGGGAAVTASVAETGGGSAVTVTPQAAFVAGEVHGTGSAGYGTGAFGVGAYGTPSTSDYFPRTWGLAAWGENLLACPRGGTIFTWTNDPAQPAVALTNAPRQVTHMVVAGTDQVFALGCNEEVSGRFNPLCVRHSSIRNNIDWTTRADSTAREYILPGGGRIVGGRPIGPHLLIWTDHALFLGTFVGSVSQPWRFDRVGEKCGLIGPNAAVVIGMKAFWISPDRQFYGYGLGGEPSPLQCTLRSEFEEHLAASQGDKIVASTLAQKSEVWFDYPDSRDGEGVETSRFLAFAYAGPDAGAWFKGRMARTARADAGPSTYPAATGEDGRLYWHERGHSADGESHAWFIETSDLLVGETSQMRLQSIWPDFRGQQGPATLTITSRDKPHGSSVVKGPYVIAPGVERVDVRATGRYHRLRFSGVGGPTSLQFGTPVLDAAGAGRR